MRDQHSSPYSSAFFQIAHCLDVPLASQFGACSTSSAQSKVLEGSHQRVARRRAHLPTRSACRLRVISPCSMKNSTACRSSRRAFRVEGASDQLCVIRAPRPSPRPGRRSPPRPSSHAGASSHSCRDMSRVIAPRLALRLMNDAGHHFRHVDLPRMRLNSIISVFGRASYCGSYRKRLRIDAPGSHRS